MLLSTIKQKGFTLIELLVVMSIISLLSSIVFASLNLARSKARDARRAQDARQLEIATRLYMEDNNQSFFGWGLGSYAEPRYPDNSGPGVVAQLSPYIKVIPNDPQWNSTYSNPSGAFYYFSYPDAAFITANAWSKMTANCANKMVLVIFQMENTGKWRQDCTLTDPKAISIIFN